MNIFCYSYSLEKPGHFASSVGASICWFIDFFREAKKSLTIILPPTIVVE